MDSKVRKVVGKRWEDKDSLEKAYSLLRGIERECVAMRHVDVSLPDCNDQLRKRAVDIKKLAGEMARII